MVGPKRTEEALVGPKRTEKALVRLNRPGRSSHANTTILPLQYDYCLFNTTILPLQYDYCLFNTTILPLQYDYFAPSIRLFFSFNTTIASSIRLFCTFNTTILPLQYDYCLFNTTAARYDQYLPSTTYDLAIRQFCPLSPFIIPVPLVHHNLCNGMDRQSTVWLNHHTCFQPATGMSGTYSS